MIFALWLLPFAGALAIWAFGPQLKRLAGALGAATVLTSFAIALALAGQTFTGRGVKAPLVSWAQGFSFGLLLDPLSLLWVFVITGVGGLIHVYSIGYMSGDRAFARFFAYMNFFVFAMLTLVLSDNFVGLLVGWGLVGLASYFLIGFWFFKPSAVAAARKAFVINVVGDIGLMFGIFVLFAATHTTTYAGVFAKAGSLAPLTVTLACFGLFVACAAKSAQLPLHTWLPDAMEGPTPVSALIHAATMVTAGVYLIARCAPLWDVSPEARALVGTIGALTALTGAVLGCVQWDIKRILAYSTMSQIGYMIMGVGVGAYQAGILHFYTHAFFKATLFLGAGILIHALHDEQDVRKMGGLARRQPFAFWAMTVGTLAIIGFPGLSGFFSKDAVIYGTLEHGYPLLYAIGMVTAGITAYYMCRMLFVTFFGSYRGDVPSAQLGVAASTNPPVAHEAPSGHEGAHAPAWLMQVPVALLMIPSVIAGYVWFGSRDGPLAYGGPGSLWFGYFTTNFATRAEAVQAAVPEWLSTVLVLALVGIGAFVAYRRYAASAASANAVERLRAESLTAWRPLTRALYFDDAIELVFVRPASAIGAAFARVVDPQVLDGAVRDVAWLAGWLGREMRALQTGLVRGYALVVVLGVAGFLVYFAWFGTVR
ncbi:MAG: NADH-quinone oxidoreductase subunit L [Candidatus Eremiobacteraeota bacterium]|nr:NADH-quinone oxidoreductase subunit L [Candidatus Eremiobacteraeota bacterium]